MLWIHTFREGGCHGPCQAFRGGSLVPNLDNSRCPRGWLVPDAQRIGPGDLRSDLAECHNGSGNEIQTQEPCGYDDRLFDTCPRLFRVELIFKLRDVVFFEHYSTNSEGAKLDLL